MPSGSKALLLTLVLALTSLQNAQANERVDDLELRSGYHNEHVSIEGVKRKFKIYVPKSLQAIANVPLVIVLHGALCSANVVRWSSAMSVESEKRGFIVIYPQGLSPGFWNAGGFCSIYRWRQARDVEFISAVIDYSIQHLRTDGNKTFVAGVSNGGMMAYRLADELPEKIAAIAPVNGAMVCEEHVDSKNVDSKPIDSKTIDLKQPVDSKQPVNSKQPVSVVAFNAKKDHIVRVDGKPGRWLFWKVPTPPVTSTIDYWVKRDHCDLQPKVEDGTGYDRQTFAGGRLGTEVCFYTLTDAGHTWPGGRTDHILHPIRSHEFSVTTAMCDFFAEHPKQSATHL